MGTRATIAVKTKKGSIITIGIKLDGYPSWSGDMLYKFWNSQERAENLVKFGGLKSVPSDLVNPKHYPWKDYCYYSPFYAEKISKCISTLTDEDWDDIEGQCHETYVPTYLSTEHRNIVWYRPTADTDRRIHRSVLAAIKKGHHNNDASWFYYWNGNEWLVNEKRLVKVLTQIRVGNLDPDETQPVGELAAFDPW